jgi:hypothetical protein
LISEIQALIITNESGFHRKRKPVSILIKVKQVLEFFCRGWLKAELGRFSKGWFKLLNNNGGDSLEME